jgi:hypothetical protein
MLALMFFGKDTHTTVGELAGLGAVIAFSLSLNRAEVRRFVRSRKREIYVGSGVLIAAAIAVSIWNFAPITAKNISIEPSDLSSLLIVVGIAIAILPSTVGVIERSQLAPEGELLSKSAPKTFDGVAEAVGAEFTMGLIVAAIVYPLADILPADTAATGSEGIFFGQAVPSLLASLMMFGGLAFVSTYVCRAYITVQPTSVPANLAPAGHKGAI